jgi:hypothetical protein
MPTDRSQILALVDRGRITVTEAEWMLASRVDDLSEGVSGIGARLLARIRSRFVARPVFSMTAALVAGVVLQPVFVHGLQGLMQAIDAPSSFQFLFNRLLEAFL